MASGEFFGVALELDRYQWHVPLISATEAGQRRYNHTAMEAETIKLLFVGDEKCGKTTFFS